jgi:lysophospholipase L1-like esterase
VQSRIHLIAAVTAIILLLISLAANIYGFTLASAYYQQLNLLRLDPLGQGAYPSEAVPHDAGKQIFVFFGDSRAEQWPAPEGLPQFVFANRGIGSQTSAQVALRYDAHVRPLEPDVLLVQVCVNDLKTLPLFPEYAAAIIEGCQRNLDRIIAQARESGASVILTTLFPVGEPPLERRPVWSDAIADSINTVNEYVHSLAADDVIVLDTYALVANERGLLRPELSADELHLNAAGYAVLNEQLITLLQNMED